MAVAAAISDTLAYCVGVLFFASAGALLLLAGGYVVAAALRKVFR